jgi:hypothetical protein
MDQDAKFISSQSENQGVVKMAVFADPHVYDLSLGTTSKSFRSYYRSDRKMLVESIAIMESMVDLVVDEQVRFVLVPGDLTKDGVRSSHEICAEYLQDIENAGIQVLVVPGNHDVENPRARSYPANSKPVVEESISPEEFESIYHAFGFEDAIAKDPNSLSYVAEPVEGIWILAVDSCNYNKRFPDIGLISGDISEKTMDWIFEVLDDATAAGVTVLGMMHHGVVEHYPGMHELDPRFLLADWRNKAERFADAGLQVVFTGHHHAQDISKLGEGENFIVDIQTGSTVTWPSPYRIISLNVEMQKMFIRSKKITQITHDLYGYSFQEYAYQSLLGGLDEKIEEILTRGGVDSAKIESYLPLLKPTLIAYYRGDETLYRDDESLLAEIEALAVSDDETGSLLGTQMLGIWNDQTPDNNVNLNLVTGKLTRAGSH